VIEWSLGTPILEACREYITDAVIIKMHPRIYLPDGTDQLIIRAGAGAASTPVGVLSLLSCSPLTSLASLSLPAFSQPYLMGLFSLSLYVLHLHDLFISPTTCRAAVADGR
jgi:hypothetical protein